MIEAPIPANEPTRLKALQKTQLLDTPLEERFERITRLVCRLLGVPTASISLVDETRQWFKSVQGSALTETSRKISFCSHTILSDDVLLVPDATLDERFHDNPLVTGAEAVKFYAGHPLKAQDGSRVGVLCAIDHKPRDFSAEDLQTLRDLAALAEAELNAVTFVDTQKELLQQLDAERRRSLTDSLTRVWNREGILEILRREHARAMRNQEHLGVLMADIDYFKQINDSHGHPAGDEALREVAKRLLAACRDFDSVGRVGGDEFLVVMPFNLNHKLPSIGKRICQRIRETPVNTSSGSLSLTISIGGVEERIDCCSNVEDLIRRADETLYRAKALGRDRMETISESPARRTLALAEG
jgi:diguanylate cyclase (GGDEF)-like protein